MDAERTERADIGTERRELKALTSLRGVAAVAVVAQHFSSTGQSLTATVIPSLVPHGYMAVDFFFVLSGFIMSYNYAAVFETKRPGAYRDFLGRRAARILPLHLSVIVLIALAAWLSVLLLGHNVFFETDRFWTDFAANLLLLPGIGFGANFNGPSWSISTEFVAYLIFPVLALAVFNTRRPLFDAAVGLAIIVLVGFASAHPRLGLGVEGPPGNLVRCFTEFTMGMAAFRLYRSGRFLAALSSDRGAFALSAACVLSLFLRYDLPAALLFPLLVVSFAANHGRAARVMEAQPFYFLGVVSYSTYLIHNPMRPLALGAAQALLSPPVTAPVALAFAVVGTTIAASVAWVPYMLIERPGRKLVRRLLSHGGSLGRDHVDRS